MDRDIEVLMNVLRRALYMRVEAVKNVVSLEHDPRKSNSAKTYLSSDADSRENQYNVMNWWAYDAFEKAGVRPPVARVEGRWLEPYRRKCFAETRFRELRRVNEIVSRLQDGLMRSRLDADFSFQFETSEGLTVARDLVDALIASDYPRVAEIADEYRAVKDGLRDVLGITEDELVAMMCLGGEEWRGLAGPEEHYHAFYKNRLSA